jgi:hypothetical protein
MLQVTITLFCKFKKQFLSDVLHDLGIIDEVLFAEGRLTSEEAMIKNITKAFDDCSDRYCAFGLLNSQQMIEAMSAWGPLIYTGCLAASLSAAIGGFLGAPRVFQVPCFCKKFKNPTFKIFKLLGHLKRQAIARPLLFCQRSWGK